MFDDYLKDGNRFLWTMQRKKFVLENVVKLTRFCTKKRNMIFYDTFGIPYKVGESPSQTPLEKKVQILLQAFHHMRKEDLIARFSYVCRSLVSVWEKIRFDLIQSYKTCFSQSA